VRHLFNTRAEVLRISGTFHVGSPTVQWGKVTDIVDPILSIPGELMCRLDLNFQRPGKDAPMPLVAGRRPDRVGVMFLTVTDAVKAGDRIHCLDGPVAGMFEIRAVPDAAIDFNSAHHMEVQVVETGAQVQGVFPGGTVDGIV
jgi:hypothetical protein